MIAVDTNVISYLLIPGVYTELAEKAARRDQWCSALLWRSEFRNVLALSVRRNMLNWPQARQTMELAERLLWGREFMVRSSVVFDCASASKRSAYNCEFVGLAMDLGLLLITTDGAVLNEFPRIAIHLRDYAR